MVYASPTEIPGRLILDKKIPIHSRNISIDCFEIGDNLILLEGTLRDDRLLRSYYYSLGEYREPGVIHHMRINMRVSLPQLVITSAEAEMPATPREECIEIKDCIKKLIGLHVKHGFTRKVRKIMGGTLGCIHLTNLVLAMGSATIQGFASYCSRTREEGNTKISQFDVSPLINSCHLWRKDGPLVVKVRESQERFKKEIAKGQGLKVKG